MRSKNLMVFKVRFLYHSRNYLGLLSLCNEYPIIDFPVLKAISIGHCSMYMFSVYSIINFKLPVNMRKYIKVLDVHGEVIAVTLSP